MKQLKYQITFENIIITLFGLFPILPNSIKGLPVVLLLILSIIRAISNKKDGCETAIKNRAGFFFIMSGIYILYLISLIYTDDMATAGNKLETGLSLLVIPLAFLLSDKIVTKKSIDYFKKV